MFKVETDTVSGSLAKGFKSRYLIYWGQSQGKSQRQGKGQGRGRGRGRGRVGVTFIFYLFKIKYSLREADEVVSFVF